MRRQENNVTEIYRRVPWCNRILIALGCGLAFLAVARPTFAATDLSVSPSSTVFYLGDKVRISITPSAWATAFPGCTQNLAAGYRFTLYNYSSTFWSTPYNYVCDPGTCTNYLTATSTWPPYFEFTVSSTNARATAAATTTGSLNVGSNTFGGLTGGTTSLFIDCRSATTSFAQKQYFGGWSSGMKFPIQTLGNADYINTTTTVTSTDYLFPNMQNFEFALIFFTALGMFVITYVIVRH